MIYLSGDNGEWRKLLNRSFTRCTTSNYFMNTNIRQMLHSYKTQTQNWSDTHPSQDNKHCGLVGYDMSNGNHKVVTTVTEELASSIFMTD
jgi:hypothetical protein